MTSNIDERSLMLLGEENLSKLHHAKVAVFGLGGVGGTAFLALARSGIGTLCGIDCDDIEPSNLNRQLLFEEADIGKRKTEVALNKAALLRQDVKVIAEDYRVSKENLAQHDYRHCDCLIDAVDDVEAKLALMEYALANDIPLLVSLGMGNRLDPSALILARLDKTEGDPLAKKLRYECRQRGIDMKKIWCVASKETPLQRGPTPSSMVMVPSAAGLLLASKAIELILKKE